MCPAVKCGHSGLITYIHDLSRYNVISKIYQTTNWECLSVEVFNNSKSNTKLVIYNIYNKPYDTVANFDLSEFSTFIESKH